MTAAWWCHGWALRGADAGRWRPARLAATGRAHRTGRAQARLPQEAALVAMACRSLQLLDALLHRASFLVGESLERGAGFTRQ